MVQEFPFPAGIELVEEKNRLEVESPKHETHRATLHGDFRPLSFTTNTQVKGDIVCAGYGLVIPADSEKEAYDSYKEIY